MRNHFFSIKTIRKQQQYTNIEKKNYYSIILELLFKTRCLLIIN